MPLEEEKINPIVSQFVARMAGHHEALIASYLDGVLKATKAKDTDAVGDMVAAAMSSIDKALCVTVYTSGVSCVGPDARERFEKYLDDMFAELCSSAKKDSMEMYDRRIGQTNVPEEETAH